MTDGYEQAFYAVAELLGITNAQPLSPKHVWETQVLPRLRDLAVRAAWSPTDDTLRSIIHYATHQALPVADDRGAGVIARARTQVRIADFVIGAIRAREHGADHFGDLYFHDDRPVAPQTRTSDYEAAWRELHDALQWMQGHKALNRYLGWNFAKIANDLIDRAYPGLREGAALSPQTNAPFVVENTAGKFVASFSTKFLADFFVDEGGGCYRHRIHGGDGHG